MLVPILSGDSRLDGVKVVTWVPDVDWRTFPMVQVRRLGGVRNAKAPTMHTSPIVELSTYSTDSLIECEEIYETALEVIFDAVKNQTQTPVGYLQSIKETMGATQFSSLYQDSWRVQGLLKLTIRKPRII